MDFAVIVLISQSWAWIVSPVYTSPVNLQTNLRHSTSSLIRPRAISVDSPDPSDQMIRIKLPSPMSPRSMSPLKRRAGSHGDVSVYYFEKKTRILIFGERSRCVKNHICNLSVYVCFSLLLCFFERGLQTQTYKSCRSPHGLNQFSSPHQGARNRNRSRSAASRLEMSRHRVPTVCFSLTVTVDCVSEVP